jgi:hypothetical protein
MLLLCHLFSHYLLYLISYSSILSQEIIYGSYSVKVSEVKMNEWNINIKSMHYYETFL